MGIFGKLSAVSLLHHYLVNCLPVHISRYHRTPANFHICDVDHRERVRQEEKIIPEDVYRKGGKQLSFQMFFFFNLLLYHSKSWVIFFQGYISDNFNKKKISYFNKKQCSDK